MVEGPSLREIGREKGKVDFVDEEVMTEESLPYLECTEEDYAEFYPIADEYLEELEINK